MVSQYLETFPQAEWPERLQELQPQFGYPLRLVKIGSAELNEDQVRRLAAGEIVVSELYDTFWQTLDGSDDVLIMGPFPSPGVGNAVSILGWLIVLVLLGIAVLFWAMPFWRKLTRISKTATEFGEGHFDVRVNVPRHSTLGPLASTFNIMADRIEQLISAQKELMNAVSHELRSPIARLRFGIELLETSDSAEKARFLRGINRDVAEMEQLVAELLDYSRFDSKTFVLTRTTQPVYPWLRQIVDEMRDEVSAELCLECAEASQIASAQFDTALLRRAIGNLVRNAAKYGNGMVRVFLVHKQNGWRIQVDDDGPGIPLEKREQIFEAFSRLDTSRNKSTGGYGLGLAIVKQVVDLHQGVVSVGDSNLGGSCFTITIPG